MQEIVKEGQRFPRRRFATGRGQGASCADEPYKLELIGLKGDVGRRAR